MSDGSNFTLDCHGITLANGELIAVPGNFPSPDCVTVTVSNDSACFVERFPIWKPVGGQVTCIEESDSGLRSRDQPGVVANLTKIANTLAGLGGAASSVGSSVAGQGLATVGCAAQAAFQQTAAYYFNMARKELSTLTQDIQIITSFLTALGGYSQQVTAPVHLWIDEADESFQQLVCYINTPDGRTSAIWRAMEKHTTLHAGLNILVSIQNTANENIIQKAFTALTQIITGMFTQSAHYVGSAGGIVQGWTQTFRLCQAKWDFHSLRKPEEQEPDEDDEDDWLPRYEIYTKAGTDISTLRGLERALDGDGSELITKDHDDSMIMGYVVDLNIMQATLPQTMSFVNWTLRFVWDGNEDNSTSAFDVTPSDMSFGDWGGGFDQDASEPVLVASDKITRAAQGRVTTTEASQDQDPWDEFDYPDPVGSSQQVIIEDLSRAHYLKSISQQKGQNLKRIDTHTYMTRRGADSWVFIIDYGFSIDHKEISSKLREVRTYVVPARLALKAIHPDQIAQGWRWGDDVIDDNVPDAAGRIGHGSGVACAAAGNVYGVARDANLFLIKYANFFVRSQTGTKKRAEVTAAALTDAFQRIYDAVTVEGIDPTKSVINLSFGTSAVSAQADTIFTDWFAKFDALGMTIVLAAGNSGYNQATGQPMAYTTDSSPTHLINAGSPVMVVGSTYHDGSLDEYSTPARGDAEISMYAQGRYVATCEANTRSDISWMDGTSFAAPQVAGLAAYMLAYPWPAGQNPFDKNVNGPTIGRRMKILLADVYAYQRVPRDRLANQAIRYIQKNKPDHNFPYPIPAKVNVAYNMAYGDQKCKAVDSFPVGIKARDFFAQYSEYCAIPDTPGSGGGGDGMTTGTVFYTDEPTYMPETWTGFSTANGSVELPTDTGFIVPCVTTGCPLSTTNGTAANMTTAYSTITNSSTELPSTSTTVVTATTATTLTATATITELPAPVNWTDGIVVSYAKACQTYSDGDISCKIVWLFFNWQREDNSFHDCRNACDAADALGTYDLKFEPPVYPNYTTLNIANVSGESGCWYNGTNDNWGGLFGCSGFDLPMRCQKFVSDGVQDVRNITCDGGLLGSTWWTWSVLDEFSCLWRQTANGLAL